jgi:hypothetical protein
MATALDRVVRGIGASLSVAVLVAGVVFPAAAARISDEASAIAEARKYAKGRCPTQASCKFKARREGKRWNVWVEFATGHLILYFDADGRLVRRIEGR